MPRNYPRSNRVEELAREVLGEAVQELKDPRVGFATVTSVKLTRDLRVAQVYVSAMGTDSEVANTIAALKHAAPHLRAVMGRQIRLRRTPELEIIEDQTAKDAQRLEELLRQVGVSKAPDELRAENYEPEGGDKP